MYFDAFENLTSRYARTLDILIKPLKLKCIRNYHTFCYILFSTTPKFILPHPVPCSSNAIIYSGLSNSASS